MASTVIIGWDEEGWPKAVPTDAEGNETIDAIGSERKLVSFLALERSTAIDHGKAILAAAGLDMDTATKTLQDLREMCRFNPPPSQDTLLHLLGSAIKNLEA